VSKSKKIMVSAFVGLLTLSLAAEARRGFSGGGSGSGTYDNTAPSVWLASDTADADCQTLYSLDCDDLSAAQLEDVTTKNALATSNNYGSHTDFVAAGNMAIRPHKPMAPYGRQPKPKPVISIQIAIAPSLRLAVVTRLRKPITAPSAAQVVARRPLRRVSAAMMIT
jgi:hypothetical protein